MNKRKLTRNQQQLLDKLTHASRQGGVVSTVPFLKGKRRMLDVLVDNGYLVRQSWQQSFSFVPENANTSVDKFIYFIAN